MRGLVKGAAATAAILLLVAAPGHAADKPKIIYTFPIGKTAGNPARGGEPNGDLILFSGLLYGMTETGGGANQPGCEAGCGVLFSLDPDDGDERLVQVFGGFTDSGTTPFGGLKFAQDNLYGATEYGGDRTICGQGCGTVFKVEPGNAFLLTPLHKFQGGSSDGLFPTGAPLYDKQRLYGTTFGGGTGCGGAGCGIVYEMTLSGVEDVLYNFQGGNDAREPTGPLIKVGNTYYGESLDGGGTGCGGDGCGTVFSIDAAGTEKVVYAFKGGSDGETPERGLLEYKNKLYGVTFNGGGGPCNDNVGCGTIFSLTTDGKEKVLYAFSGTTDGYNPQGGLIEVNGTLYGTTHFGGVTADCDGLGCGTVFSITPKGKLKTLYAFTGEHDGTDGCFPEGALLDKDGDLYGTTKQCGKPLKSIGTVFRMKAE